MQENMWTAINSLEDVWIRLDAHFGCWFWIQFFKKRFSLIFENFHFVSDLAGCTAMFHWCNLIFHSRCEIQSVEMSRAEKLLVQVPVWDHQSLAQCKDFRSAFRRGVTANRTIYFLQVNATAVVKCLLRRFFFAVVDVFDNRWMSWQPNRVTKSYSTDYIIYNFIVNC